jgi:20S proteasome alpha/beta subunit
MGRQFSRDGKSDLHVVNFQGRIDRIFSWKAIGKGESSANPIVQRKLKEDMDMKDFVLLSYCIIRYTEQEKPEESVGESRIYDTKRMMLILILNQARMRLKNFRNLSIPL